MRILVTRPEPDASAQAIALQKLGHEVLVAPMLTVETCAPSHFDHSKAQAVIATSRNALHAIAVHPDLSKLSELPLYVVGPNTANVGCQLGFQNVITGPAAATDLAQLISERIPPEARNQRLLYLAPEQPAFDLKAELQQIGFSIDQQVVYRTLATKALSAPVFQAISEGMLDGVILMSARTAAILAELLIANGLQKPASTIMFLCFSKAVAGALQDLNPHVVEIAIHPRSEEMLALVHRMSEKSR